MSQCTCTKDKEITCIVHPTIRSLKEYITYLEEQLDLTVSEADMLASNQSIFEVRLTELKDIIAELEISALDRRRIETMPDES